MNLLNFFTKSYTLLHNYPCVPFWALTPFRRFIRNGANKCLPFYLSKHKKKVKGNAKGNGIIVSFTSFPARINNVWMVVESLKNQSLLPEKIILWLSKDQFPTKDTIPDSLWDEEDELFEIRMVDGDIRSHKKFFYVLQKFPDKAFITCDDDIYYHPDMLKHIVDTSKFYPKCIVANTTRCISYDRDGNLLPYNQWKKNKIKYKKEKLIQIGVGGVLYPPNTLYDITLQKNLFLELTPMADDIWLNAMARLKGTPVVQSNWEFIPLPIFSRSSSLSSVNKGENMNDIQLKSLRDYLRSNYRDIYSLKEKQ